MRLRQNNGDVLVSALPRPLRHRRRGRWSTGIGLLGELLLTLGVLLLLFVLWQLWWTDVLAGRAFTEERQALQQEWAMPTSTDHAGAGDSRNANPVRPIPGKAFGLVFIPQLRDRAWAIPVLEGTDRDTLTKGMGHHEGSAMPGELGNFTLAGHRTTYGAPLHDIDQLQVGDEVIIQTGRRYSTYTLTNSIIIQPHEGWILDPVPGLPADTEPDEALLTMYSCHPKFSAAQRFVWFGRLTDHRARSAGPPAALDEQLLTDP